MLPFPGQECPPILAPPAQRSSSTGACHPARGEDRDRDRDRDREKETETETERQRQRQRERERKSASKREEERYKLAKWRDVSLCLYANDGK